MSNPKLLRNPRFASGPLIPTFAKVVAAIECECWNWTTGAIFSGSFGCNKAEFWARLPCFYAGCMARENS
jgi:hypothetical protein